MPDRGWTPDDDKDPLDRVLDMVREAMSTYQGVAIPPAPFTTEELAAEYRALVLDVFKGLLPFSGSLSVGAVMEEALTTARQIWLETQDLPVPEAVEVQREEDLLGSALQIGALVQALQFAIAEIEVHNAHAGHNTPPEKIEMLRAALPPIEVATQPDIQPGDNS